MVALHARQIYPDEPAAYRTIISDNPTLLITWWATGCSLFIILMRCFGRYVRTMRLFRDDWWMLLSVIPLLIRLSFAHIVLKYGTNNTQTDLLSDEEIRRREIGSGVVLGARVFFVTYIWIQKFCITEFYKRLTTQFWRGVYDVGLKIVRWGLLATLIGAIISIFVECQPFNHYWQVVPDPGPKCRNGVIPLLVTGSLDIFTDVILVIFPIPAILYSKMPNKRKGQLIALFSLSLLVVAVVCGRIPATMDRDYLQPFRTLMASLEILAATFASNALVLSSFLRDKGPKRPKFKSHSEQGDSRIGRSIAGRSITARNRSEAGAAYWGSDEDLVRDTGFGHELENQPTTVNEPETSPSDASTKVSPSEGFNRHYSSFSPRDRADRPPLQRSATSKSTTKSSAKSTTSPTPQVTKAVSTTALGAPPIHSTSTNVRSSNWGFPLEQASRLKLNTTGIAVTTIETRYSPISSTTPGQAFEMSTVTIGAAGHERRTSIGGGRITESRTGSRERLGNGDGSGSGGNSRTGSSNGRKPGEVDFNDVGGLLK